MSNVIELYKGEQSTVSLLHYADNDVTGCEMHIVSLDGLCAMFGYFVENIVSNKYLTVSDVYHIVSEAVRESKEGSELFEHSAKT